jgi:ankyrin repeat protein
MRISFTLRLASGLFLALLALLYPSCRSIPPFQKAEERAAIPEKVTPKGFLEAATAGDLSQIRNFLAEDPSLLERKDTDGWDALSHAAWNAHFQLHEYLLLQGAEGNLFTEAALGPWESFLQRLDTNPIGVSARDPKHKATPLIWAVRTGNRAGFEVLVSRGADVSAQDREGNTALHHAALMDKLDLLEYLLFEEAIVNMTNDQGKTALHMVTAVGDYEACQLLLDRGADINSADTAGNTSLHIAAERGYFDLCEYYLFLGARTDLQNRAGLIAGQVAGNAGHERVAELLQPR